MSHSLQKSCILVFCPQSFHSISFLCEICICGPKNSYSVLRFPLTVKEGCWLNWLLFSRGGSNPVTYIYLQKNFCRSVITPSVFLLLASAYFLGFFFFFFFGVTSSIGYFWQLSLPESVSFSFLRQTGDSSLV